MTVQEVLAVSFRRLLDCGVERLGSSLMRLAAVDAPNPNPNPNPKP